MSHTVQQFRSDRGCLSYIVADDMSKKALVIDPSEEVALETYLSYLEEKGLALAMIIETHTHADHISSGPLLRERTGARIIQHENASSSAKDESVHEDVRMLGTTEVHILYTPGHTDDSVSIKVGNALFTGDTLLIGGTGRTDFQKGSSEHLHTSLWEKLMSYPNDTLVYPGHNYKGETHSTIGREKEENPRLQHTKEEFIASLDAHNPPKPDLFDEAISKNSQ